MKKQTAGRDRLGDFAPKFAELNDDVLFGEVWSREDKLSLRDRSLVTICVFMGKGLFDDSLKHHLMNAKNNGITKEEMAEIITQGNHGGMFGLGEPNTAYAQYFIGNSYLKPLAKTDSGIGFANVTFEPGCRNNWHIHKATAGGGQVLICIEGEGWYQEEGKPAQSLKEGDIVVIPANVKHWHGAKKDSWFSHIAVEVPGEGSSNEWCEPVNDEEYMKL